jgi:uncharacterized membrane protein
MALTPKRYAFVDFVRGAAIVPMVLNHTGHSWLAPGMPGNETLSYLTVTAAAPVFLFVAGFSFALGWSHSSETWQKRSVLRDLKLVILGYALNQALFPGYPYLALGPLQTIGLCGLLLLPLLPYLSRRSVALGVSMFSIASYALFAWKADALGAFVFAHPRWAQLLFFSMPLWPWASLIFLGAVLGSVWCASDTKEVVLRRAGIGGEILSVLGLGAYFGLGWRDFEFHCAVFSTWFPGPAAALWVVGLTPIVLWATSVIEKDRALPPALLTIGKHALLIYVLHRVFVITVMANWAHFTVSTWWGFAAVNAALLFALWGLARLRELRILSRYFH